MRKIFQIIPILSIVATSITFGQTHSLVSRGNLLLTTNVGFVELLTFESDVRIYSGFYFQLKVGRNLIPLEDDFVPRYASQYSLGLLFKMFNSLTPTFSVSYGYSDWENNKSDPTYNLLLPPESAHFFTYFVGIEFRTATNIYSGLSIGNIRWNYSNGLRKDRTGIQFYTGLLIW